MNCTAAIRSAATFAVVLLATAPAGAQLTDTTQVDEAGLVAAPGGTIAKSLEEQVGGGHGDAFLPGSSVYLIKRDPARSIRRGRQLFQRKYSAEQGLGPRVNAHSFGDITATRALGAGLADSCAACHGRPRGAAGFGGAVATRPDSRDAPHLFGLGLQEMLADEMTAELRDTRRRALELAERSRRAATLRLRAKRVSFGRITALPDGTIDASEVEGVDPDLRIRPFFAHGGTASIREFIVGALNDEMGLQAYDPVLCAATDGQAITSPAGFRFDPELDTFQRPPACAFGADPDGDGVADEIDAAVVDHLEFYLLNYFKPGTYRQTSRTRQGRHLLRLTGCTSCHVERMLVFEDRRIADVETEYDPENGIFNDLFATARTRITEVDDGQILPQLLPQRRRFLIRNFYSDLKRHDLGPAFHERDYDGTVQTEFVTEPLWGVGSTSPYGHDGRSINLDQVIRRHGGEAQESRDAYVSLSEDERAKMLEFLRSLVLFPPDDTASNLNPGNPGTGNPQDPAEHGNINLGVLFQDLAEGPE